MKHVPHDIPQSLQDLPPKWAHFCLHVEQFIQDELEYNLSGRTIVTALSGGVDSTALLLVLHYLSKKNDCTVIAAHLNHQIRPEALDDAQWVQGLCDCLNIPIETKAVDISAEAEKQGIGLEEAGRNARYAFYEDICLDHSADMVALGHHLGDLCEDVLMRMIRGTAWPGLSGMSGIDHARQIIRPFLLTPKSKLKAFLRDNDIEWREDATNTDPSMTRNRVRHTLLPLFLQENPNFPDSVARLWKVGRIDADYWNEQIGSTSECLSHSLLRNAHKATRLRMYKAALDALDGGQALADTLFRLDNAWCDKRYGSVFQFPGNKIATITSSGVLFSSKH